MSNAIQFIAYQQHSKSKAVAYLLWFFFGGLGAHRFYMRSYNMAWAILISWIVGVVCFCAQVYIVAFFLYGFISVMVLVDIFLIPGIVNRHNARLLIEIADPLESRDILGIGA